MSLWDDLEQKIAEIVRKEFSELDLGDLELEGIKAEIQAIKSYLGMGKNE